jgi:hypothetical protein
VRCCPRLPSKVTQQAQIHRGKCLATLAASQTQRADEFTTATEREDEVDPLAGQD